MQALIMSFQDVLWVVVVVAVAALDVDAFLVATFLASAALGLAVSDLLLGFDDEAAARLDVGLVAAALEAGLEAGAALEVGFLGDGVLPLVAAGSGVEPPVMAEISGAGEEAAAEAGIAKMSC
jgi:hypothetical protein